MVLRLLLPLVVPALLPLVPADGPSAARPGDVAEIRVGPPATGEPPGGPNGALPPHPEPPAPAGSSAHGSGWLPPLTPADVIGRFAPPERDWLPGHRGVDLRADPDNVVRAVGAGTVTHAAEVAGRGVVVVDHGGLRTTYEPVAATVQVGQQVSPGSALGLVAPGSGHCGSGECLHLGLRRGDVYLDPMLLIAPSTPRLRPW